MTHTAYEAGKTYKTRGGRSARIYALDAGGLFPLHGAILSRDPAGDRWVPETWQLDGLASRSGTHDEDLKPIDPKRDAAINECLTEVQAARGRWGHPMAQAALEDLFKCVQAMKGQS